MFSIIPYFDKGGFNDNVKGLVLKMSLGKEDMILKFSIICGELLNLDLTTACTLEPTVGLL